MGADCLQVAADKHQQPIHGRAANLTLLAMASIQLIGLQRAAWMSFFGGGLALFVAVWLCGIAAALIGLYKSFTDCRMLAESKDK